MPDQLPPPIADEVPAWETALAVALGYTLEHDGDLVPTCWNLPEHPFAFLEDTAEVVVWEVDGPLDEHGLRQAHVDPNNPKQIALTARRVSMPPGFAMHTLTTPDGATHRIALASAA